MTDSVHIDVLIRCGSESASRPSVEHIETARRLLHARGLALHATNFGVSGSADPSTIAAALDIAADDVANGATLPIPEELVEIVDQITVAPPPEMFSV